MTQPLSQDQGGVYVSIFDIAELWNSVTRFSKTSSGVEGGTPLSSEKRRAAFRQFLIRGASCAFPSDFCSEGTGWYVLNAVFISGKTRRHGHQLSELTSIKRIFYRP